MPIETANMPSKSDLKYLKNNIFELEFILKPEWIKGENIGRLKDLSSAVQGRSAPQKIANAIIEPSDY